MHFLQMEFKHSSSVTCDTVLKHHFIYSTVDSSISMLVNFALVNQSIILLLMSPN